MTTMTREDGGRNEECAHTIIDYVLENWAEDPAEGLEAVLTGSPDMFAASEQDEEQDEEQDSESFWSVKARQLDFLLLLLGALIKDLEQAGLLTLWTSGGPDFDRDVARALWQLGPDGKGAQAGSVVHMKLPAQATAMAQAIGQYQDIARKVLGQYVHVEAFPGALLSHCHDPLRLRRAGKAEWIAFTAPLLDRRALEGKGDLSEILGDVWELVIRTGSVDLDLRFRDADGWTAYNARFGFGTLREAVVGGLERASRLAGMYEVFGTEADDTLEGILHAFGESGMPADEEAAARLEVTLGVLGPARPIGLYNPALELDVAEGSVAELIDLAAALFPEPKDLPALGTDVAFRDTTLFAAIDDGLIAFVKGAGVEAPEQRAAFADAVSVFCRALTAMLAECFETMDSPPGRATELLHRYLKLNVFNWWREATRRAALLALRQFLTAALKSGNFGEIDPAFAAALSQYGVTAEGWAAQRADSGIVPADAAHSTTQLAAAAEALQRYWWERLAFVMLEPDAPGHADLCRGAKERSAEGELLRFMARFRNFHAPSVPKPLADREPAGTPPYRPAGGNRLSGIADFLIWLALLERTKEFAAEVGQGKTPSPTSVSWFVTARARGTLGLCTDFLFGEATGLGVLPLSNKQMLSHPAVVSAFAIWQQARYAEDVRVALATWAERQGDNSLELLRAARRTLNDALAECLKAVAASA